MTYKINDKVNYFFKGDEDNEPCEDVMIVKALKDLKLYKAQLVYIDIG